MLGAIFSVIMALAGLAGWVCIGLHFIFGLDTFESGVIGVLAWLANETLNKR